jgi:hypothetical protein
VTLGTGLRLGLGGVMWRRLAIILVSLIRCPPSYLPFYSTLFDFRFGWCYLTVPSYCSMACRWPTAHEISTAPVVDSPANESG